MRAAHDRAMAAYQLRQDALALAASEGKTLAQLGQEIEAEAGAGYADGGHGDHGTPDAAQPITTPATDPAPIGGEPGQDGDPHDHDAEPADPDDGERTDERTDADDGEPGPRLSAAVTHTPGRPSVLFKWFRAPKPPAPDPNRKGADHGGFATLTYQQTVNRDKRAAQERERGAARGARGAQAQNPQRAAQPRPQRPPRPVRRLTPDERRERLKPICERRHAERTERFIEAFATRPDGDTAKDIRTRLKGGTRVYRATIMQPDFFEKVAARRAELGLPPWVPPVIGNAAKGKTARTRTRTPTPHTPNTPTATTPMEGAHP